jgi:hypothetical protein
MKGSSPHKEVLAMARFTIDTANSLIEYNRRRLAQLAEKDATRDPLLDRVVRQLELSMRSLERQRDEMLAQEGGQS